MKSKFETIGNIIAILILSFLCIYAYKMAMKDNIQIPDKIEELDSPIYKVEPIEEQPEIKQPIVEPSKPEPKEEEQKNTPKEMPYIENEVLYTTLATINLRDITRIEVVNGSVRFVIINYQTDKYHWGGITMDYYDFLKLVPQLQELGLL